MRHTAAALRERDHDVFHAAATDDDRGFDVLHAFGAEPDVWHVLRHWRRSPAPLVISPVLVVPPSAERGLRLVSRLPVPDLGPRMKADVLRRADALIALTRAEQRLLARLAAPARVPITVIGNGVEPIEAADRDEDLPTPYVVLLGTISPRKQQLETVEQLADTGFAPVVLGGFEGDAPARARWVTAVDRAGGRWLGEVSEAARVRGILRHAAALVHLSSAEGQSLAVLEALAEGTPVVASRLPSTVELADELPGHLRLVDGVDGLRGAVSALPDAPGPAPVPTWDDVALAVEAIYERVAHSQSGR
jgi:glycosyltransferase involved in cell wall biosynthesis